MSTRSMILVALFGALTWEVIAAEQPKRDLAAEPTDHGGLMRRKLEHTRGMLEGLATEDFALIQKHAKLMNELTTLEQWSRPESLRYRAQLNIFWSANKEMMRHAKDKNLDGAALSYTQMTLSCVNCHKFLRDPTE
jgi:hypothetical protein